MAHRRQAREEQKRQRDLARQAVAQAKLSERQRAQWEVDAYENKLDLLLSVHKEKVEHWDWPAVVASLPPAPPRKLSLNLLRAQQDVIMMPLGEEQSSKAVVLMAEQRDESDYSAAVEKYRSDHSEWEYLAALGRRIVAGEPRSYIDAIEGLDPLAELSEYGASAKFTIHSVKTVSCELSVSDTSAVPLESKTLTATGKLSTKATPRARFQEIYQDYICSCMLRVARETFALLPIEILIVTVWTSLAESGTAPVLSAAFTRPGLEKLDFDSLDPSDAVELFTHRGAFKASRKAGAFQPIIPLVPSDLMLPVASDTNLHELRSRVADLRNALAVDLGKLKSTSSSDTQ